MKQPGRFFYGWVIIAVGLFVMPLAYGVRYSFSVIFPSLLQQYDWPRGATAAILSFHFLAYGITAPIAGALVDRLGTKKTMGLGGILMALGAASSSLGSELWHFYLTFGLLMGVGLSLMGSVPFTRVLANWFVAKRGLAISLMYFGGGVSFIIYPAIAFLIEKMGWRGTFLVEGAMVIGLLLPLVFFLVRYHPQEMGLLADGHRTASEVKANPGPGGTAVGEKGTASEWTLLKAVKTFRFWALCFTAFASWGLGEHILVAHHVAFAEDVGYSRIYASSVLSLFGVFMMVGTLAAFISDRIGREVTFTIGAAVAISGVIMLMLIKDTSQPWMLYAYAILFGLGFGMVFPTVAVSATDMFQGKRVGEVLGFVWFAFALGGTVGPWLGGIIFEIVGSYFPAFVVAVSMFIVGTISMWIAAPRRAKPVVGRARVHSQSPVLRGRG